MYGSVVYLEANACKDSARRFESLVRLQEVITHVC